MEFWSEGTEFIVKDKWSRTFPGVYTVAERAGDRIYFWVGSWRTWINVDRIRRPTKLDKALK